MLLSDTPKSEPATPADLIRESSEATFMEDVVATSSSVPVIVDFWAPWCGPCKTLGPMLEKAVIAARGKVRMVKVNVDENQQIAAQLRIQSIPTVYAFWQGQPVDGFQGAVPGSQIDAFVAKLAALADDGGLGAALDEADAMLEQGAAEDAAEVFAAIAEQEPDNARAVAGLVRARIALGALDEAEAILNGAEEKISRSKEIDAAHAQLALARQAAGAGPQDALAEALAADPANAQLRFDLATALYAQGKVAEAVDELLELFRRDRDWNDGAAKAQLFVIFEALKPQDPIALNGRRKLSSLIFA